LSHRGPSSESPPPDDRRRGSGADEPSPASGEEVRDIVSEVLKDQAERRARQREAGKRQEKKRVPLPVVATLLAIASLYVWAATPSWIVPEPLPAPTAMHLQAGRRMEMYGLVVQSQRFRDEEGRLPRTLSEAVQDPPTDVTYTAFGTDEGYRIEGTRAGTQIVYTSGDPVQALLDDAPDLIRRGLGASS